MKTHKKTSSLPAVFPLIDLQETFRAFFTHKIDTIRNNLDVVFVVVVVVFPSSLLTRKEMKTLSLSLSLLAQEEASCRLSYLKVYKSAFPSVEVPCPGAIRFWRQATVCVVL